MIIFEKASFFYGQDKKEADLDSLSLTIADGEVVLLCGESGCGKTTLTRLINGLIPHYYEGRLSGSITVNGLNIRNAPLYETAKMVGSVFQNPRSQFFNVDTTSELAFGCENLGLPEAEIHRRLKSTTEAFGLDSLCGRNIFKLSGGEKQKIACGSVAALHPEVMVLDEPSSNLDTASIKELKKVIRQWKAQGKTIVVAEHRLYYLEGLADRVVCMKKGRIDRIYTGREFYSLPHHRLEEMGLRALSMSGLSKVRAVETSVKKTMRLEQFQFAYPHCPPALSIGQADVPERGVIGIIGHNGAGKSTFARSLCGLQKRDKGIVRYKGTAMKSKKRLSACYMVMQDVNHQLFTESVLDEVLLSMKQETPERASSILESLDLLEYKEKHPMALSGGQKQRVAVASAVASQRKIIVFDEPTSGLDLRHMQEVSGNIRVLAEQGRTVFVVTHDPELILSCCTHILHIDHGRLVGNYPLDAAGRNIMLDFFLKSSEEMEGGQDHAF
ncbi:energy-coupling factor ABC transporter ATP-binding protein [Eubacterium sp. 1001713B170207_170306_E7]|uniref:ABC transporter ATP-binding protein n=1 Tax=Eubacterium sp. 1001713B170207_170306_E7 TaxID=2787097 RepID=UPI00189747E7|nr:energy-coupling factor ABC transporter ATP-binding protein [Eubacterium sp. 1001713B170207_170306_E7]